MSEQKKLPLYRRMIRLFLRPIFIRTIIGLVVALLVAAILKLAEIGEHTVAFGGGWSLTHSKACPADPLADLKFPIIDGEVYLEGRRLLNRIDQFPSVIAPNHKLDIGSIFQVPISATHVVIVRIVSIDTVTRTIKFRCKRQPLIP